MRIFAAVLLAGVVAVNFIAWKEQRDISRFADERIKKLHAQIASLSDPHFYSMLAICEKEVTVCDVEHSVYSEQSPPIFESEDECADGALEHLWMTDFRDRLKEHTEYQIDVTCEMANPPELDDPA